MIIKQQSNIKKEEILLSKYIFVGHIDNFFKVVKQTGYPYFEWNDMVYKVDENTYKTTNININEVK
jgi:hypothetical protein